MTENLHDMTVGNVVSDGQIDKLQERYDKQRYTAEDMLDALKQERETQIDFISDTQTLNMVPIADELKEQIPQVEEQTRLIPSAPQVAIIPREGDTNGNDQWYGSTGPVILNSHAHEQVSAQLKIPRNYYKRMLADEPDLLAMNVNRWMEETPARRMFRVQRQDNIGVARAYLSDRYRRLDNLELAESFLPMLIEEGSPWRIHQCGLTTVRMHIEAIFPTMNGEVKVGDEVALAVKISSSEVGSGALSVQLGVHRLMCSNLMVVPKFSQRQIHLGRAQDEMVALLSDATIKKEDQLIIDKMRDVVTGMADTDKFQELLGTMKEGAEYNLNDPIKATEILCGDLSLTTGETNLVKNNMITGGDATIWGLTNALTASARDLDMERKSELELAAGKMMETAAEWKRYGQAA